MSPDSSDLPPPATPPVPAWGVAALQLDTNGAITDHNPAAGELLGRAELRGVSLSAVFTLTEAAEAQLQRAGAGGVLLRAVMVRREDQRVFADVWFGPADPRGRAVMAVDVTRAVATEAEVSRLRARLNESERARAKLTTLHSELNEPVPMDSGGSVMIGASPALQRVRQQVARVAGTNTTVLIHGETGSGKELVARSIHALSDRKGQAFVPVNCGAIPETLIESEMFGHERGAFTGADKRRLGKFELADGGTLFLDEIAELPLQSQAKLLRVLQESAFERVGGSETIKVNVRVVAASHRDLARQVERGRFREDLFYRLNVFSIQVPPLRARKEDLRPLAEHLHERVAKRMARPVLPLSARSVRRLLAYEWPGNVRELANTIERATLLADGAELEIELPESPLLRGPGPDGDQPTAARTNDVLLDLSLEQLQRLHITHALERCGYRVFGQGGAAQRLELNPRTLLSKMDKFGILRPRVARRASDDSQPRGTP